MACVSLSRGQEAKVVAVEGTVKVRKGGRNPAPAAVGVALVSKDEIGTDAASRAVLRMTEKWFARLDEFTDVTITPAAFGGNKDALRMALGGAFIYSREEEGTMNVVTPSATGGMRGTQLAVRVFPDGRTVMQVIEGQVELANELGSVLLNAGEAGEAAVGQAPRRTAVIETRNLLQWALYYPAVLLPEELGLSTTEQQEVAESLAAYRQGDLLTALERYPKSHAPVSDGAKLYRAGVLLATGRVDGSRHAAADVAATHHGRRALERMTAAVLAQEQPPLSILTSASETIAESYYRQSRRELEAALAAAKRATELAPQSGFTWTRLAELEFSFGHTTRARVALGKALTLTPRHAQAHALRGFLLSAEHRMVEARAAFEHAMQLDPALSNAWLGLGLSKIRMGAWAEGRADLQTAVTVEPTRAFLYSYHGKALSARDEGQRALKDFVLAKQIDPEDPTPWLYAAIERQQENRYNEAVAEMERSLELNDNRRVYRSQFLLEQDRAVRRANLARIYQNDGLADLAVREATRAVENDYSNPSAHLFLANSFDARRDPKRISLRFETAWFNELLLAHLLAPVGAGSLSPFVTQQEYSRLLEADGVGGSATSEWRERGQVDQRVSLWGTKGRVTAALEFAYFSAGGERVNDDVLRKEAFGQAKFQVSADDVIYGLVKWQDQRSGDISSYDDRARRIAARYEEKQEPGLLLAGWNHRWAPGAHTLLLAGRLAAEERQRDFAAPLPLLRRDAAFLEPGFLRRNPNGILEYTSERLRTAMLPPVANAPDGTTVLSADFRREVAPFLGRGPVTGVFNESFDFEVRQAFEIYSAELQHLWQTRRNTLIVGARAQTGEFKPRARLELSYPGNAPIFTSPAAEQVQALNFQRRSVYAYDIFAARPELTLIAGAAWDVVKRPENFRRPPLSGAEVESEATSGKLGFTFAPSPHLVLRGIFAETLGGVSFDESVRLEPVQLAGFNQAFRTVIPESLVGSVEVPRYENAALSASGRATARTWWSAAWHRLDERVTRTSGAFDVFAAAIFPIGVVALPASTHERLRFREDVFVASLDRLFGEQVSAGVEFSHTRARLRTIATQIPTSVLASADAVERARLRELTVHANWNSPAGWFARAEARHLAQRRDATAAGQATPAGPGDTFWHVGAEAGRRFPRNRHELSGGVLNLTDRDHALSPLTFTRELPRAQTFFVRARVTF